MALRTITGGLHIQEFATEIRSKGERLAFVPTMGALHKGHLALIQAAAKRADKVACSIFVNPTQFNDPADFDRYPRIPAEDQALLKTVPCDVLFLPQVATIYPKGTEVAYEAPHIGQIPDKLEGRHRPGHFNGVMQVVSRLFELVQPHEAYFGLKDYQQYLIILHMTKVMQIPVDILGIETVREADGLALSSRNRLLSDEDRVFAPILYEVLQDSAKRYKNGELPAHIRILAESRLVQIPGLKLDYFDLCDALTLESVQQPNQKNVRAFVAAFLGKIRLIDNIVVC